MESSLIKAHFLLQGERDSDSHKSTMLEVKRTLLDKLIQNEGIFKSLLLQKVTNDSSEVWFDIRDAYISEEIASE